MFSLRSVVDSHIVTFTESDAVVTPFITDIYPRELKIYHLKTGQNFYKFCHIRTYIYGTQDFIKYELINIIYLCGSALLSCAGLET